MDELKHEKSCDNVISKLIALSLQYTCCWVVFYSRERLSLEWVNKIFCCIIIFKTKILLKEAAHQNKLKLCYLNFSVGTLFSSKDVNILGLYFLHALMFSPCYIIVISSTEKLSGGPPKPGKVYFHVYIVSSLPQDKKLKKLLK